MYIPESFRESDPELLYELMRSHSFATLFNVGDAGPMATHLPMMVDPDAGENGLLIGHMARANPQWRAFNADSEVLVCFLGPHSYISPAWYQDQDTAPTWNYAAVHVYGVPRLVEDRAVLRQQLRTLIATHEAGVAEEWDSARAEPSLAQDLDWLVGFEIPIRRVECTLKLNQNRSMDDRMGVVGALGRQSDSRARSVAEWMRRTMV